MTNLNAWKHTRPDNGTRGVFGHSWSARGIDVIFIKHAVAGRYSVCRHAELQRRGDKVARCNMMMYEDIVREFAVRTRKNLEALRRLQTQRPDIEVYEVTQLINSMLGLLVFPQQKYVKRIPKTPLADLVRDGWPIPQVVGNYPQVKDLNKLIRYLRNAISHCNLEFLSDDGRQIIGLLVWNTDPKTDKTTWNPPNPSITGTS